MSSNSQPTKSKWGVSAFFQQAVSGVESRLDVLLANEEDHPTHRISPRTVTLEERDQDTASALKSIAEPISHSSSNARTNDRLQERLARAMVKPNRVGSFSNHFPSAELPSRASTPRLSNDAGSSLDNSAEIVDDRVAASVKEAETVYVIPRRSNDFDAPAGGSGAPHPSPEKPQIDRGHRNCEGNQQPKTADNSKDEISDATKPVSVDVPSEMSAENEDSDARLREEIHGYIERIDALQSKLKYLAKEAAETARKATSSTAPGSMERKLLEKEERIALLLEEGRKLSKTELDNRSTIKMLRQQIIESSKAEVEGKKKLGKLERDLAGAEARASRGDAAERKAADAISAQAKTSRDLEAVTLERDALNLKVQDLKTHLDSVAARFNPVEEKARSEALGQAKRRITELEDDLSSARIERELSEEKLRREITGLQESLEREKEGARIMEAEHKNEQSILESKMEGLRARVEEASSSTAGDTQVKLLRQVETLQTQYAIASENWQGIEGSLLSRLANVETERDDVARREADLRRKAREMSIKTKKAEEEAESSRELVQEIQQGSRQELERIRERLQKAEDDLGAAKEDFAERQEATEAIWAQKLEEEKARWRENAPLSSTLHQPRADSPLVSSRKSTGLEMIGHNFDRPLSRRSSNLPIQPADYSMPRENSFFPLNHISNLSHITNGTSAPTIAGPALIHSSEPEEYFTGSTTPATPSAHGAQTNHSRGINDIISVSTVAAGPSVQLVERMSATIRRLESERAASKEELSRLTAQRDQARQEVIKSMREVEEKRKSDNRIRELEAQVQQLDERYQTTLELFGEKTEQAEELQADIADLKKIYREVIDRTMR